MKIATLTKNTAPALTLNPASPDRQLLNATPPERNAIGNARMAR